MLTMTGSPAWPLEWSFDVVAAIYELVTVNESVYKISGGVSYVTSERESISIDIADIDTCHNPIVTPDNTY